MWGLDSIFGLVDAEDPTDGKGVTRLAMTGTVGRLATGLGEERSLESGARESKTGRA